MKSASISSQSRVLLGHFSGEPEAMFEARKSRKTNALRLQLASQQIAIWSQERPTHVTGPLSIVYCQLSYNVRCLWLPSEAAHL